jgi:predicted dehydrogenase
MEAKSTLLRVALVGCGAVAQLYYTPALAELERRALLAVKALFDPHPARVAQLQKAFPAAVRVNSLDELPKLAVDLAIIASPPRFHAEQTLTLLGAGLSVLCEKPMAATVAEGEAMIEAALAAQRVLAVGLFRRFFPATQMIRDVLRRGVLGQVQHVYCFEGGNFRWPAQSVSFFLKTGLQGGVLFDIGVHVLDLLLWWWGQPVEVCYEDDAMGGIEANCRLTLRFAQGFFGEVRLSRDWSLPNRYVIQGTKGWLSWQVHEAEWITMGFSNTGFALHGHLHDHGRDNMLPTLGQPGLNFGQSFVSQLCNVIEAIHGSARLVAPGEQALQSLKLIEYCYQHRTLMAMPWLNAQEYQHAQQLGSRRS